MRFIRFQTISRFSRKPGSSGLSRLNLSRLWLVLGLVLTVPVLHGADPGEADFSMRDGVNVEASLVSEVDAVVPGQPFWILLRQQIRPGWHTYWHNPGDSGAPTKINWALPAGFSAGDIQWPFPERIPYGPLVNFGYNLEALYPILITPPSSITTPVVTLKADVGWLVCADICIPENATLTLNLDVAAAGSSASPAGPETAVLFQRARQRIPVALDLQANWEAEGEQLALRIEGLGSDKGRIQQVDYFPFIDGIMENPAPQILNLSTDSMGLTLQQGWDYANMLAANPDTALNGIVVVHENIGSRNDAQIVARAFEISPQRRGAAVTDAVSEGVSANALWIAVLFAFLGGMILNLMPCVFPVLSIKVLSLVQQVGDTAGIRRHGWIYLVGVVLSFTLIAALLIVLRAGGAQIGWGFQLQSPWVIGLLVYLFFLIGLNLSGYFELGGSLMGVGQSLVKRQGYSGSFFTGVLATVVAAPCTAPFMATAIGFALTQSNLIALTVFAALGLGMAAPYVVLCYSPALLRAMPRPGPWMARFKELLAFPMYASAIWLVWVLAQQAGETGVLAVLAGLLLLVFSLWLVRGLRGSVLKRRLWVGSAVAVAILALSLPLQLTTNPVADADLADHRQADKPGADYVGPAYTDYSAETLAALQAKGPVFVNFTAAWCITCKVNEVVALDREAVRLAFEGQGVSYLKGDWTNEDPAISRKLEAYGRSGVPLYLLYPGGAAEAQVLPQILTEGIVLDAVASLNN